MNTDEAWLETVLKRKNFESSVVQINKFEKTEALGRGENFQSVITRAKAELILVSGRKKNVSLILKKQFDKPFLKKMSVASGFFVREIVMYRDILPKMEDLMNELGDTGETLWSQCYDIRLYDWLVLEDLKASGYTLAGRREQLPLNNILLVVRTLAKFHAMSSILVERSEIPLDIFGTHVWSKIMNDMFPIRRSLFQIAKSMDSWGDEWKEDQARLVKSIPSYASKVEAYLSNCEGCLTVLNHGDCWTNNLFFRCDEDTNLPLSMKFVDLQLCHLGTPAHDLLWLMTSSVTPESRKLHVQEILTVYSKCLANNLRKFGYSGKIPSEKDITKDFRNAMTVSLWLTSNLAPFVLPEEKGAVDLEEIRKQLDDEKVGGEATAPLNIFSNLSDGIKNVIKGEVRDAIEDHLI